MGAFSLVQKQFFPTANRPELIVDLKLAQGASWAATDARGDEAREVAGREPRRRLLHVLCRRRQPALLPADRAGARQRELRPGRRHDQGPRRARASWSPISNQLFGNGFEAVRARVQRLQNGPPVSYPVMFRVLGDDPQQVRAVAEQVRQVFKADPATRDINFDWNELAKTVRLEVDQNKARALGVRLAASGQHAADAPVGRDRDAVPRPHRDDRRRGPRRAAPSG